MTGSVRVPGASAPAVYSTRGLHALLLCPVQWPGVAAAAVKPPNAGLRLFGGAAFARVLQEFQEAARCLEFPAVQRDRVANILLAFKSRWGLLRAGRAASRQSAAAVLVGERAGWVHH